MKVIPIYQDLRRPRTGIIVGRHGKTVGPGAHDRQKVSLLGSRNFPILGKKITALADRSHYIGYDHLPLSFDDRTDRLIRTVESGTDQVIHAAIDNYKCFFLPLLQVEHLGNQDPGISHNDTTRFEDQGHIQPPEPLDQGPRILFRMRRLLVFVADPQSPAQIEIADSSALFSQGFHEYLNPGQGVDKRRYRGKLRADMAVHADDLQMGERQCPLVDFQRAFDIDAELTLFHSRGNIGMGLGIDIRIDPQADRRFLLHSPRDFV